MHGGRPTFGVHKCISLSLFRLIIQFHKYRRHSCTHNTCLFISVAITCLTDGPFSLQKRDDHDHFADNHSRTGCEPNPTHSHNVVAWSETQNTYGAQAGKWTDIINPFLEKYSNFTEDLELPTSRFRKSSSNTLSKQHAQTIACPERNCGK